MTCPKRMICACCGNGCLGRQWWNRDTGYGLCKRCIPFILEREGEEELKLGYGVRGIHFDITEDVSGPVAS